MISRKKTKQNSKKARHKLVPDKGHVYQWLLGVAAFIIIAVIVLIDMVPKLDLTVGSVAPETLYSPRTIRNNYVSGRLEKQAAEDAARKASQDPNNFEINQVVALDATSDVTTLFEIVKEKREDLGLWKNEEPGEGVDAEEATNPGINEQLPITADDIGELQGLAYEKIGVRISNRLAEVLLLIPASTLEEGMTGLAQIVGEFLKAERIAEEDVPANKAQMAAVVFDSSLPEEFIPEAQEIAVGLVKPNLTLNLEKVKEAERAAIAQVKPVMVKKESKIVGKGEVVNEEQIQILTDLGMLKTSSSYPVMFGALILLLLLFAGLFAYMYQYERAILTDVRLFGLLCLVSVLVVFLSKLMSVLSWPYAGYLAPVAMGTMLMAILVDSRLSAISAIAFGIIVGLFSGMELKFAVVAIVGGLTGVYSVSKASQRSDITRGGFIVGIALFFTIVAIGLIQTDGDLLKNSWVGLVNGLLSGVLAIGVLPYLETLFGITSSIRLLELSNPNQPLLRRLLIEAPGTYHHSIIVGNLAESAADAIDGNSILARVGAHYHDIGKLKRPYFFGENQFIPENPHDKIAPSLSTLIIVSHTKDGAELAKQYKLPQVIIDFTQQHHGTDLVKFFYHRALENSRDGEVEESDFRYPGPKPQTKETAIVMLADSVEAAVRSLSKPTAGRIDGLARKIIKDKLNSGQLDESDLTLKDLDTIAQAFSRVLSGIYHSRVQYPETVVEELQKKAKN
ncbi:MAG: HDIG domain-containing protein [Limnochordia bacterium]|nr:HDIG domain-containing protein [Limnochordia bacterium]MDD2628720.1 HDIG domain-containing protein [Limnochordia bacterium]